MNDGIMDYISLTVSMDPHEQCGVLIMAGKVSHMISEWIEIAR